MQTFYLGAHHPNWLDFSHIPLFVSDVTLRGRRSLPRAKTFWALDSGGFSELSAHGRWTVTPEEYVARVRRYASEIGQLRWAAIQDWMCEEVMLKKTGLKVEEHQRRTVDSYLRLMELAPELPWAPVIQGYTPGHYLDCIELYQAAGVDLKAQPIVGIGSVCRRQGISVRLSRLIQDLAEEGYRIHGFGFKTLGLKTNGKDLTSADSMAWSTDARYDPPIPGHQTRHKHCNNCFEYAEMWHRYAVDRYGNLAA